MKIVNTRIKRLEEIDPSLICCDKKKELLIKEYELERIIVADLNSCTKHYAACTFCGRIGLFTRIDFTEEIAAAHGVMVQSTALEYLDIDEG